MNLTSKDPLQQAREKALSEDWCWAKLGEICDINPRRPVLDREDIEPTSFIPMESIDAVSGTIAVPRTRPYAEVKKGYTCFKEGDVLFAKITPCMQNGKHAIANGLVGRIGFGTTEFHVLRPGEKVISEWIWYFVRRPSLLLKATEHFTGAVGQQRLPESYLVSLEIPLPPLPEQRRIARILRDQMAAVEKARNATKERLAAIKAMPAAFLRQAFAHRGKSLPDGWRWVRLGDVLRLRNQIVHPRDLPSGSETFVGLEHIEPDTGRRIGALQVELSELTGRKPRFFSGDIVYGYLRPYLNKVWIAEFDGLSSVDQYAYGVDTASAIPEYVAFFMRSAAFIKNSAVGKTPGWLPRIRKEEVASVVVPLPPLAEQYRIAEALGNQMAEVDKARAAAEAELEAINALPAAILRRAFMGEL